MKMSVGNREVIREEVSGFITHPTWRVQFSCSRFLVPDITFKSAGQEKDYISAS